MFLFGGFERSEFVDLVGSRGLFGWLIGCFFVVFSWLVYLIFSWLITWLFAWSVCLLLVLIFA